MKQTNMIKSLNKQFPGINAVSAEEFDGRTGGIWFRNSEGYEIGGLPIMNPYTDSYLYKHGTHRDLENWLADRDWHSEPYDNGTLMAYK